eukprot:6812540-Pyramimonas_sp.AAC.1
MRNDPGRGQVFARVGNRDVHVQRGGAGHPLITDCVGLRSQPNCGATCSDLRLFPDQKGALQMTSEPLISTVVVSVRLAESVHKLPAVTYADSCALVHYDSDVNTGFIMKLKALP